MFTYKLDDLKALFDYDNIHDGISLANLRKQGCTEGLLAALKTGFNTGIVDDMATVQERIQTYGLNIPEEKEDKAFMELISEGFQDNTYRALCVAAVVYLLLSVSTEGWWNGCIEGLSILAIVTVIVTIISGNRWIKEKQLKKLNTLVNNKYVKVYRHGQLQNVSVQQLLVGDIQILQKGDIISVDGFLLEEKELLISEQEMTGEIGAIKKSVPTWAPGQKCSPFILSNSRILEGTGRMVVLVVGDHTLDGMMRKKLQVFQEQTPLQQKLSSFGQQIGKIGKYAAVLTLIYLLAYIIYAVIFTNNYQDGLFSIEALQHLAKAFIVAAGFVVVTSPRGLPLALTISLSHSVAQMQRQNNLVRYLEACQTIAGVDDICLSKSGFLTSNLLRVTHMFVQERTEDKLTQGFLNGQVGELFSVGVCLNSRAQPKFQGQYIQHIGSKIECALLQVARTLGYDYQDIRKDNSANIIKVIPFSQETNTMSTVVDFKGKVHIFSKGAPQNLITNCAFYLNANGEKVPINDTFKHTLFGKIKEFREQMLRTLLIAYRIGDKENASTSNNNIEQNLIIIGLVGISDKLKEEVPAAVEQCNRAGVRVRMITGDSLETAVAVAKRAGILPTNWKKKNDKDCSVMTGQQLRAFVWGIGNDEEGNEVINKIENFRLVRDQLKVLARCSPADKLIMPVGLKQLNHVIAMVGHKNNDAPALRKADVSFSMGIVATDLAKQSSSIILLDDNLSSVVAAMKWGRNLLDSTRKFLQFQLTLNLCAFVMIFGSVIIFKESPLSLIHILWVNLIIDTLACLALATERPNGQLLQRKTKESLITPEMWKKIVIQGVLQIIILSAILFMGPKIFGVKSSIGLQKWAVKSSKHYCIFFHTFVLLQIFNEINARKLKSSEINVFKGFFDRGIFSFLIILTVLIQCGCVELGGRVIKTVPLSMNEHLYCLGLGIAPILVAPIFNLIIPVSIFGGRVTNSIRQPQPKTHQQSRQQQQHHLRQQKHIQSQEHSLKHKVDFIFKKYSKDGSNSLSREEVVKLLEDTSKRQNKALTPEAALEFLKACNFNHNGRIQREELEALFRKATNQ